MAVNSNYNPPGGNTNKNYGSLNNEIKSHSSVLFNERMHVMLYILETGSIEIHASPKLKSIMNLNGTLFQLWKMVRTMLFYDPACRRLLELETDIPGKYSVDVGFELINTKIQYINKNNEYNTYDNLMSIIYEMDQVEIILRNILQFYKYFIRFEKPQKPDIDIATQRYKDMVDERTKNELKEILGKRAKIDLDTMDSKIDDSYFEDLNDIGEQDGD